MLLASSIRQGLENRAGPQDEGSGTLGSVHLVRRDREAVDAELLEIQLELAQGLDRVRVHVRVRGPRSHTARQGRDGVDPPDLVVHEHAGHESGALVEQRIRGLEVQGSARVHGQREHLEALLGEAHRRAPHAGVLVRPEQDARALAAAGGPRARRAEDREAVRLGPSAGEAHAVHVGAHGPRDAAARLVDGRARSGATRVTGRRVAPALVEGRYEDGARRGREARGRRGVEVDRGQRVHGAGEVRGLGKKATSVLSRRSWTRHYRRRARPRPGHPAAP